MVHGLRQRNRLVILGAAALLQLWACHSRQQGVPPQIAFTVIRSGPSEFGVVGSVTRGEPPVEVTDATVSVNGVPVPFDGTWYIAGPAPLSASNGTLQLRVLVGGAEYSAIVDVYDALPTLDPPDPSPVRASSTTRFSWTAASPSRLLRGYRFTVDCPGQPSFLYPADPVVVLAPDVVNATVPAGIFTPGLAYSAYVEPVQYVDVAGAAPGSRFGMTDLSQQRSQTRTFVVE